MNNLNPKHFGVVKAIRLEKGFFFILSHYSGEESSIFAHVSQILPGCVLPKQLDRALFHLAVDSRSGRTQAVEVEIFPPAQKAGA